MVFSFFKLVQRGTEEGLSMSMGRVRQRGDGNGPVVIYEFCKLLSLGTKLE